MDEETMQTAGGADNFMEGWDETGETELPDENAVPDGAESPETDPGDAPAWEEPAGEAAPEPPRLDGPALERLERQRQRTREDVREFRSVFPEAARDYRSIPQQVWDDVKRGMSLVAAYSRYHNARVREETEEWKRQEAVWRRNAENAARSAGSMRSSGSGHGPGDPFLEGWDEN